ncbi:murein L,D-transpeptidase catalytic domain family protein [Hymenobacter jeollabukensis]|uniref:Murein L,D-transpeptidase catalytic domain family protein n=1 Tax=Hymenobacter jeollabukensis TaxID=2025313 RepID=A0A5R8WVC9_9BACT|nr:murein L,D-transpeptidase catalytic domain family protein [Hymenobacter jeollabukensis]TLM96480.1 murein L,D-transpeptidase catalytic domain family protein [Hymenobacter jeollabukensis]
MTLFRSCLAGLLLLTAGLRPALAAAPTQVPTAAQTVAVAAFEQFLARTYTGAKLAQTGMSVQVLRNALIGYFNLRGRGLARRPVLTVIDFSRPSRQNRLWVIDLSHTRLLYHTLVAHGKNSGGDLAQTFSNREGSEMSSLGFYLTGDTYQGKHGLSLKLQGLDARYNSHAAERAVVVHAADYVCEDFIRQNGRLGRSQGCPALPPAQSAGIIKTIKSGSVLYVQGPSSADYASDWLNLNAALPVFMRTMDVASSTGQ